MTIASEVVENGIKLLDTKELGWRDKIDKEIDIKSTTTCPLGQIYKNHPMVKELDTTPFLYGVYYLGISGSCHLYGFGTRGKSYNDIDSLNEEWKRQLS